MCTSRRSAGARPETEVSYGRFLGLGERPGSSGRQVGGAAVRIQPAHYSPGYDPSEPVQGVMVRALERRKGRVPLLRAYPV